MKCYHNIKQYRKKLKPEKGAKKSTVIQAKPRKKTIAKSEKKSTKTDAVTNLISEDVLTSDHSVAKTGHMTPEEVERHLESRRFAVVTFLVVLSINLKLLAEHNKASWSFPSLPIRLQQLFLPRCLATT